MERIDRYRKGQALFLSKRFTNLAADMSRESRIVRLLSVACTARAFLGLKGVCNDFSHERVDRVRECKPLPMFEELEQRIVLDATVDSGVSHTAYGWDLEYASNPSSSVAPVIEAGDLADYQGTLSPLSWAAGEAPSDAGYNTIIVPGGSGSLGDENVTIWWQIGGNIHLAGDATADSKPVMTVTSPYEGGWVNLQVDAAGQATVTGNGTATAPSRSLSITGSVGEINSTLDSLRGQFPEGYNTGNYWETDPSLATYHTYVPNTTTLLFSAFDTEQPSSDNPPVQPDNTPANSEYHAYFVDGENATPTITAPRSETVNQNIPFPFTGTNLISVQDLDWEYEKMELIYCQVTVANGRLDVLDTSSLNRYSHDTSYKTWQFEAYLPWLNQALSSLQYTGVKAGIDTMTVTVNDWGNHGGESTLNVPPTADTTITTGPEDQTNTPVQTAREATATISINVLTSQIDNTPTIDMDPSLTLTGAGPFAITPAISLGANDADQLDVALLAHHGNLSFNPALPSGVTTVIDTQGPPGDSEIYLRGPQTLLNYSLNNLQYTPYAYSVASPYNHFTGSDTLTVAVMDNGSHLANRDPVERTREQNLQIQVNP